MNKMGILRIIAACMLAAAIVFVAVALSNPGLGNVWAIPRNSRN